VTLILVTQFNSLYQTVLVMSAIVFSTAGVLLGLLINGQSFGIVMVGMGVIALAGIVVNNNIVLIDAYNVMRSEGLSAFDAALGTGCLRLRPVLLTAITTILGLMPMVLGVNVNLLEPGLGIGAPSTQWWTQLSSAITGGLAFATVLTLLLTPCMLVLGARVAEVAPTFTTGAVIRPSMRQSRMGRPTMGARPVCVVRYLAAATLLLLVTAVLLVPEARGQDVTALRARFSLLQEQFANSPFQRPLLLESIQTDGTLKGDVHAIIAHPYGAVRSALLGADHWCDILMLHLNVKGCQARDMGSDTAVSVFIGRKVAQPLADAYQVDFNYRVAAGDPDYLQVLLDADTGPLGTKNYRIALEAIPLDAGRSFVYMTYSYSYGLAARLAMKVYLGTTGRGKVGFSIVGHRSDGAPIYIDGERGVVERNTMRYYLAIEAYLGAQALSPAERDEQRLRDWFDAVERYPRQLHELERDEYVRMKQGELARQRRMSPR